MNKVKHWFVAFLITISVIVAGCGTTGITGNSLRTGGTIANPDGSFEQIWTEHVRDSFGKEMIVMLGKETKSVYNERTKKYDVVTSTRILGVASGDTWENKGAAGFVSNLPNAAGDMFGAWILRGADWGTNINNKNDVNLQNTVKNTNKVSNKVSNTNVNKNTNNNANFNLNNNQNTNKNTNTNTNTAQGGAGGSGGGGGNSGGDNPGHGYGDQNHDHTGPPGQNK